MAPNGPRMTQNDPKWPKNDPKWPTITPKWPKNEQELCEPISLERGSELRDWLTRPLLGSERRSSVPALYATLTRQHCRLIFDILVEEVSISLLMENFRLVQIFQMVWILLDIIKIS